MCVTCKIPLNVAESPQSQRERAYIRGLIAEGKTEAQIKSELVAQYGSSVLALPSAKGFDLAAYLVPVAVVLALIGLVALLLPSWRRHARAQDYLYSLLFTPRSLHQAGGNSSQVSSRYP